MSRSPQYYLPGNVYDAALDRIRWLWDEFDGNITVSVSGGKDSTVLTELALIVARENHELPLHVVWLDQEAELEATVEFQRDLADRPDIRMDWYQIPFKLFNATNHADPWLDVWGEGRDWLRQKEPDSIHVNDFGKDRFKDLLVAIGDRNGGATLTGMRAQESPGRYAGVRSDATYKWVTWTHKYKHHRLFFPIYDWSFRDVWKAIDDGGWAYNQDYEHQFQYGVPPARMRVSNYHHETALPSLFRLQETEPETWEKAVARLEGVNTAGHLGEADFYVTQLPYMFRNWGEYFEHLVDNLVPDPDNRARFRSQYATVLRRLPNIDPEPLAKAAVKAVLRNDLYFTGLDNLLVALRNQNRAAAQEQTPPQGAA